jgi:hypothetical protein
MALATYSIPTNEIGSKRKAPPSGNSGAVGVAGEWNSPRGLKAPTTRRFGQINKRTIQKKTWSVARGLQAQVCLLFVGQQKAPPSGSSGASGPAPSHYRRARVAISTCVRGAQKSQWRLRQVADR